MKPSIRFSILLLATAASICEAQQGPTVIYGVVTNPNGVLLAGVEITVEHSSIHVVTNDSGKFVIDSAPTGRVLLNARRFGFKPQQKGFKLDPGGVRKVDFSLEGIATELDSVIVLGKGSSPRMAGFYARRDIGNGAFITRADIERHAPYVPSDLLRLVTGVHVLTDDDATGHPTISMGRTGEGIQRNLRTDKSLAATCSVSYYLDGSFVPSNSFHIDDLSPNAIEAIEIYRGPSEAPPQFRAANTACGLIVIWTREPPPKPKEPPSAH